MRLSDGAAGGNRILHLLVTSEVPRSLGLDGEKRSDKILLRRTPAARCSEPIRIPCSPSGIRCLKTIDGSKRCKDRVPEGTSVTGWGVVLTASAVVSNLGIEPSWRKRVLYGHAPIHTGLVAQICWCPRWESNPDIELRTLGSVSVGTRAWSLRQESNLDNKLRRLVPDSVRTKR
jgi:hypothetical protein